MSVCKMTTGLDEMFYLKRRALSKSVHIQKHKVVKMFPVEKSSKNVDLDQVISTYLTMTWPKDFCQPHVYCVV